MNFIVDECLLNVADGAQDRILVKRYDGYTVIAAIDGHGIPVEMDNSKVHLIDHIDAITDDEWAVLLAAGDPLVELANYLDEKTYNRYTGAVIAMARIYPERVEIFTLGDSSAFVFLDDKLAYTNPHHTAQLLGEVDRLRKDLPYTNITVEPTQRLGVIKPDMIQMVPSTYTRFRKDGMLTRMAPTRALGHGGITGYRTERRTIEYVSNQKLHVVVCSDGVADMMVQSYETNCGIGSDERDAMVKADLDFIAGNGGTVIANWARDRWSQEWTTFTPGYGLGKQRFAHMKKEQDDVCCVTYTRAIV